MTAVQRRHQTAQDSAAAVDAFMAQLVHPARAEVVMLRALLLAADPSIAEGIKWKAPSFRVDEYFATIHLRVKQGVGLILHLGAKVKSMPAGGVRIADPHKLLTWLAPDRAMIQFRDVEQILAEQDALHSLVREWIKWV